MWTFSERLLQMFDRAQDRAVKVARRYRYTRREFGDVEAFCEKHTAFARRVWMLACMATECERYGRLVGEWNIGAAEARDLYPA